MVDGGGIMDVGVWWMEECNMDVGVWWMERASWM